jgi:hypothetical protein
VAFGNEAYKLNYTRNPVGRSFDRCLGHLVVCAETSTVLRALAADLFFNYGYMEIPLDNLFGTYQGASTVMHKAFDWKRSRIFVMELEALPQSIPQYACAH